MYAIILLYIIDYMSFNILCTQHI